MPLRGGGFEFIGAFESTYAPHHDRDVFESNLHHELWEADLDLLRAAGVRTLRYPARWHRIESSPGHFDWSATDEVFHTMLDHGLVPIVDLVHHTSYPAWLEDGFADRRFGPAFMRYAEALAERYPFITAYTLFNEPFATLFLAGHEALWPPYRSGVRGFVELLLNVMPTFNELSRRFHAGLPAAWHVWVDSCEAHTADPRSASARAYAELANDRRFFVLDVMLGTADPSSPFGREVMAAGGAALFDLEPGGIDVLGLDYYAHSQWHFMEQRAVSPSPYVQPLWQLICEYAARYPVPVVLAETNIRGFATDRATWLKYTLEQCELAAAAGVDLRGYCWFPFIDSCDWDSLLARCDGTVDPVGVYWLDHEYRRRPSEMSTAYAAAVAGAAAAELPAYALQQPVRQQLRGYASHMADWEWVLPPVRVPHGPDRQGRRGRHGDVAAPTPSAPLNAIDPDEARNCERVA